MNASSGSKSNRFICDCCSLYFTSPADFFNHELTSDHLRRLSKKPINNYRCIACDKDLHTINSLIQHYNTVAHHQSVKRLINYINKVEMDNSKASASSIDSSLQQQGSPHPLGDKPSLAEPYALFNKPQSSQIVQQLGPNQAPPTAHPPTPSHQSLNKVKERVLEYTLNQEINSRRTSNVKTKLNKHIASKSIIPGEQKLAPPPKRPANTSMNMGYSNIAVIGLSHQDKPLNPLTSTPKPHASKSIASSSLGNVVVTMAPAPVSTQIIKFNKIFNAKSTTSNSPTTHSRSIIATTTATSTAISNVACTTAVIAAGTTTTTTTTTATVTTGSTNATVAVPAFTFAVSPKCPNSSVYIPLVLTPGSGLDTIFNKPLKRKVTSPVKTATKKIKWISGTQQDVTPKLMEKMLENAAVISEISLLTPNSDQNPITTSCTSTIEEVPVPEQMSPKMLCCFKHADGKECNKLVMAGNRLCDDHSAVAAVLKDNLNISPVKFAQSESPVKPVVSSPSILKKLIQTTKIDLTEEEPFVDLSTSSQPSLTATVVTTDQQSSNQPSLTATVVTTDQQSSNQPSLTATVVTTDQQSSNQPSLTATVVTTDQQSSNQPSLTATVVTTDQQSSNQPSLTATVVTTDQQSSNQPSLTATVVTTDQQSSNQPSLTATVVTTDQQSSNQPSLTATVVTTDQQSSNQPSLTATVVTTDQQSSNQPSLTAAVQRLVTSSEPSVTTVVAANQQPLMAVTNQQSSSASNIQPQLRARKGGSGTLRSKLRKIITELNKKEEEIQLSLMDAENDLNQVLESIEQLEKDKIQHNLTVSSLVKGSSENIFKDYYKLLSEAHTVASSIMADTDEEEPPGKLINSLNTELVNQLYLLSHNQSSLLSKLSTNMDSLDKFNKANEMFDKELSELEIQKDNLMKTCEEHTRQYQSLLSQKQTLLYSECVTKYVPQVLKEESSTSTTPVNESPTVSAAGTPFTVESAAGNISLTAPLHTDESVESAQSLVEHDEQSTVGTDVQHSDVDIIQPVQDAVGVDVQPIQDTVGMDVQPIQDTLGMDVQPVGVDVQPVQDAVGMDVQPVGVDVQPVQDAVGMTVQPVGVGVQSVQEVTVQPVQGMTVQPVGVDVQPVQEMDVQPVQDAVGMDLQPVQDTDAVGMTIQPVQDAVGMDVQPVQDAVGMDVQPVQDAVGMTIQPVQDAVGMDVQPVQDAVGMDIQPVQDAVGMEVQPVQDAVGMDVQPVQDAVGMDVQPVQDAVGMTIQPVQDAVGMEVQPVQDAVGMEVQPVQDSDIPRVQEKDVQITSAVNVGQKQLHHENSSSKSIEKSDVTLVQLDMENFVADLMSKVKPEPVDVKKETNDDNLVSSSNQLSTPSEPLPDIFTFEPLGNSVLAMRCHDNILYACSSDKATIAYDVRTGRPIRTYANHEKSVTCLELYRSVEGTLYIYTGSSDRSVNLYNAKSGKILSKFRVTTRVMHLAVGSNLMFIALKSGSLAIINLETRKLVGRHNCHSDSSQNPAVSCTALTNTCLFTAMFDYTVMCWDITKLCTLKKMARDDKLQMLHKISTFTNTVLCLMINNNLLFCGSADKSLQVFDITTWERVRCLNCHGGAISGLQIMGNLLITSCFDKFVRCFDVQNFNLLQIYGGHSDMIFSLIVNNGMIYTGCRDGKIRSIKIDLTIFYECKWIGCKLRFGVLNHLQDHLKDHCKGDSSLLAQCKWDKCTHNAKSFATLHNHLLTHLPLNNTK